MTRSTRDSEKRIHEKREEYNMDFLSPLDLPPGVAKEGYSYHFVNTAIKGDNTFRVEEMAAKGWTPVPADRSSRAVLDPLDRNPLSKKYISYKDVILMERPEIYSKKETAAFNHLNNNKIRSLRGVSNDIGSFGRQATSINRF